MSTSKPTIKVSVIMRRERIVGAMSRWQTWRWVLEDVLPHEDGTPAGAHLLSKDDCSERWLHVEYKVELYTDDAEGYYLNVTTDAPCWFVLWRMEEIADAEEAGIVNEPFAKPEMVSLSYHDAGRWLDAQETVEQVPLPAHVRAWLQTFVDEHHVLETKRRKRPESFKRLEDRFGNPVAITTDKNMGGGNHHG